MDRKDLNEIRIWYSEDIREVAPVIHNGKIIDAFATVPREHYLGAGPWQIHSRLNVGTTHQSATDSPHHLYHDVLVSIDQSSGINNGLPSLWAMVFDNLNIQPGATVLQIGAGVGYFTAILAELVTETGRVIAYEIEDDLATRASCNLQHYSQVEIISGDATKAENLPELNAVLACAGVTHIPDIWLDHLGQGGQIVVPFTASRQWGFLLHLTRDGDHLPVRSLGPCGFYHCAGARDTNEEEALTAALKVMNGSASAIGHYCRGPFDGLPEDAWMIGNSFWISMK